MGTSPRHLSLNAKQLANTYISLGLRKRFADGGLEKVLIEQKMLLRFNGKKRELLTNSIDKK